MNVEELLVDFYNGASVLKIVASWSSAVPNQQVVLEQMRAFEKAYEQLVELHARGALGVGAADFSEENLALVRRINQLLQPGLNSDEALQPAEEVRALAERCLEALTRGEVPPAERKA